MENTAYEDLQRVMAKLTPAPPDPRYDGDGKRRPTTIEDVLDLADKGANVYLGEGFRDTEVYTRLVGLYGDKVHVSRWMEKDTICAALPNGLFDTREPFTNRHLPAKSP